MENERQLNNQEVCKLLNRYEDTIEKQNEDAYKHLEHMKRQNIRIALLTKELRELKKEE